MVSAGLSRPRRFMEEVAPAPSTLRETRVRMRAHPHQDGDGRVARGAGTGGWTPRTALLAHTSLPSMTHSSEW